MWSPLPGRTPSPSCKRSLRVNSSFCSAPICTQACYKRMALMLHPDKNPDESAAAAFKRVSDAWDALGTPLNRAE